MKRAVKRYTFVLIIALTITAGWAAAPRHAKEHPVVRITRKPTGILYSALPTIELYPDGFVWIQRSDGTTLTRTIGVARLSMLLKKLDRLGFYRITTRSVDASIQQPRKITKTPNGVEAAMVTVQQDAKVHTVSCYAVEEMAEHYPRASDLNILKKTIAEVYKAVGES
jgi:hypothetical protein